MKQYRHLSSTQTGAFPVAVYSVRSLGLNPLVHEL